MSRKKNSSSSGNTAVSGPLIGAIALIVAALITGYFGYLNARIPFEIPINATQTAEARLANNIPTASLPSQNSFTPSNTPTSSSTDLAGSVSSIVFFRDNPCNIFSIGTDGKNLVQLTDRPVISNNGLCGVGNTEFAISPDGKKIAYNSWLENSSVLYVMNRNGTDHKQITFGDQFANDRGPSWSYDGNLIVFSRLGVDSKIYITDLDGGFDAQFLTEGYSPVWSPVENLIAFTYEKSLYVIDPNSLATKKIASNLVGFSGVSWSPNGQKIAYVADTGTSHDIFIADVNSSSSNRITKGMPKNWDQYLTSSLVWSPRGDKLAFDFFGGNSRLVYLINTDGSNMHALVVMGETYMPAWSLDGSIVSYFYQDYENNTRELYSIPVDGIQSTLIVSPAVAGSQWLP